MEKDEKNKKSSKKKIFEEMKRGYLRGILISSSVSIFILIFLVGAIFILGKASEHMGDGTNSSYLSLDEEGSILEKASELKEKVSEDSSSESNEELVEYVDMFSESLTRVVVLNSNGKSFITFSLDRETHQVEDLYYLDFREGEEIIPGIDVVFKFEDKVGIGHIEKIEGEKYLINYINPKTFKDRNFQVVRGDIYGAFVYQDLRKDEKN